MLYKKRFLHHYLSFPLVASLAISSACTQKADPQQQQQNKPLLSSNPILDALKQEQAQASWISELVKDSKAIEAWEENEGLIALFQGNTATAFEKLAPQLQKLASIEDQSPDVISEKRLVSIGFMRASLALSETHALLHALKKELFFRWSEIEAQREASLLSQEQSTWLKNRFQQQSPSFDVSQAPFTPVSSYQAWQSAQQSFLKQSQSTQEPYLKVPSTEKENVKKAEAQTQLDLSQLLELHAGKKSFTLFEAVDQKQIKLKIEDPSIHLFYQQYYAWAAQQAISIYLTTVNQEERAQNAILLYQALALDALGRSDDAISTLEAIPLIGSADPHLMILSENTNIEALAHYRQSLLCALYYQKALKQLGQKQNHEEFVAKANALLAQLTENVQKKSLISSKLHLHYAQAFKMRYEQLKALNHDEVYDLRLTSLPRLPAVAQVELKEEVMLFPQVRQPMLKLYQEQIANHPKLVQLNLPERLVDAQQRKYAQSMAIQNELVWALKNFEGSEERGLEIGGRNTLNALLQNTIINLYTQRLRVASTYLNRIRPNLVAVHWSLDMLSDLLTHQAQQNQNGVNAGQ